MALTKDELRWASVMALTTPPMRKTTVLDRSKMNARFVNCSSNGKWAGPFYNISDHYYGTGITPETTTHGILQPDFTQPFEIHVRAKLHQIPPPNVRAFICGTNANGEYWRNPSFEFRADEHIFAGYSVNGTDWTGGGARVFIGGTQHPEDNIQITVDGIYDLTYKWTGEVFSFGVSDGRRYVEKQVQIATPHYQNPNYPFIFGNNAQTAALNSGLAMLDMEHTYIKVNGIPVWGAGY